MTDQLPPPSGDNLPARAGETLPDATEPPKRRGNPGWKKGQSGNPSGRPRNADTARLREGIRRVLPGVLLKVIEQAMAGDMAAAKLLLDRALPPLRPQAEAVPLTGETPAQLLRDVLQGMADGIISPTDAESMARLIVSVAPSMPKDPTARPSAGLSAEAVRQIREIILGVHHDAQ